MNVRPIASALLALAVLLTPPPEVKAMGCQGINAHGHCLDSKTVEWCNEGVLQTAKCPDNEICAKHEDYGDGYLCISKELTECAGIPDEGLCGAENQALWCVEGELASKDCGTGEVCGHDSDHGWVDCIPEGDLTADAGQLPPEGSQPNDASGDDSSSDDASNQSPEVYTQDATAPMPNVTEGKPWQAQDPDGCGAGPRPTAPIWVLCVVLMVFLRRERCIR